jgi:hypothetical protein
MEFQFPWPMSQGEWLAWSSAGVTILFGLIMLFLPRIGLRILRLQPVPNHPEAVAEARATMAGFYLGVGISCIVMAQIWLYLALGLSWLLTAFGRMVAMLSDGANTPYNWISVIIELVLSGMALGYGLGLIL